jgi:integrase
MLQLLKESGWRPIEVERLKSEDFDLEQQKVTLNNPAKGSNPRQIKLSNKLTAMLSPLILKIKPKEKIWNAKPKNIYNNFRLTRNKITEKLGNQNIRRITLRTFRHFKATMEYHKTKDILHVMRILGHKNIKNTLIYTHLVNFESDEYVCKVANSIDEASELIEAGFDFVTHFEEKMLFKKRK